MILRGRAHKYGDDIDTDAIIPGKYLKVFDPRELAEHAMEGLDPGFIKKVESGDFIVAGKNFGCGSSREHAPMALSAAGIKAVLAKSFARIFYRNSINGGYLLPVEIDDEAYRMIDEGDELELRVEDEVLRNLTKNLSLRIKPVPDIIMEIYMAGGIFRWRRGKV